MKTGSIGVAALALSGAVGAGGADVFLVDIAFGPPSGISLMLCQDLPVVGGCDTDTSDITGTASFRVDTTAGTVELVDFSVSTSDSLDYTYEGVLSEVNATSSAVDVFYAGASPTSPVVIGAGGAFAFTAVPVDIEGTADITGTVLGFGGISESIDFAEFGPFEADLSGSLTESAGVWTLESSFTFDESTMGEVLGITVTTTATGSLTLDGTGTGTPEACAADCDANTILNVDDIDCFVAGFLGGDLGVADCTGNGVLNVDDIDCYVTAFLAGCS